MSSHTLSRTGTDSCLSVSRSRSRTRTRSRVHSSVAQSSDGKLTEEEESSKGTIPWSCYAFFLRAFGPIILALASVCAIAFEGSQVLSLFWLGDWTESSVLGENENTKYIIGYAVINLFAVLASTCQGLSIAQGCNNAAQRMHEALLEVVLRRPTDFFVRPCA